MLTDSDGEVIHLSSHEKRLIKTTQCGDLTVYVQGQLHHANTKAVFLTVHDMGSNHAEFCKFVDHPSMTDVKERSLFIHVDLPGQEDHAADLAEDFQYPSMKTMSNGLVEVIDALKIPYVIGMGEGAGANVLLRFGMDHPQRCLGLILIHCTSTSAGVMEHFRDKLINWKLSHMGMNPTAEQYLVFHKFGRSLEEQLEHAENKENVVLEFQQKLRSTINPRNLRRYVESFLNRTDLSDILATRLKTDVMMVTGTLASHLHTVHTMASHLNKTKSTLIQIEGVGDVLNEAPDKFATHLVLYVQGLGKLSSLPPTGSWNRTRTTSGSASGSIDYDARRTRSMSMEEYDVPNIRRLSIVRKETN